MIPPRFIRIWLGPARLEPRFCGWWNRFQELHPDWKCATISDAESRELVTAVGLEDIYSSCETYAGRSDVARIAALYKLGGIYVDCDVMPLRPFDPLLEDARCFAGKRSGKSFESAILGSPPGSEPVAALIKALPSWYEAHHGRAASVRTGPAFVSSVWWGRPDVWHLPASTFYPFNGFGGPRKVERDLLFRNVEDQFPPGMFAAHYSNHRWGGRPR